MAAWSRSIRDPRTIVTVGVASRNTLKGYEMKTLDQLKERALDMAIGHYLSDFPDNRTNDEIMNLIRENDDDIVLWQPFEGSDPQWVAEQIETMCHSVLDDLMWAAGLKD